MTSLEELNLFSCTRLATLPNGLCKLERLRSLTLGNCKALVALPGIELPALESLDLTGCEVLDSLPAMNSLVSLRTLNLFQCERLLRLPLGMAETRLQELRLTLCKSLADVEGLALVKTLQTADLYGCVGLTSMPDLSHLPPTAEISASINDNRPERERERIPEFLTHLLGPWEWGGRKAFCLPTRDDRVGITRKDDHREGEWGTIVELQAKGAMVRFDDGSVEGFKHSSFEKEGSPERPVGQQAADLAPTAAQEAAQLQDLLRARDAARAAL